MSYICERCGKIVEQPFGSGRYCSRTCANIRIKSEETKEKVRKAVLKAIKPKQDLRESIYYKNPNHCKCCGKILKYSKRHHFFCSDKCENLIRSEWAKKRHLGGITKGHGSGIAGKYKGIRCDSKYELAYLVYCLENNIKIKRNKKSFKYLSYDAKIHNYYPDFYLENSKTYVELKGYYQSNTPYKVKAMQEQNINFKILYWDDIKYCLDFIRQKFNIAYETLEKLYDKIV